MEPTYCKLEIFIPATHLAVLQDTLAEVDAGHIGRYDRCLSYSPVTSCWRPLEGTNPYLGAVGQVSTEPELKVEVTCLLARVDATVEAVKRVHPYEEPVINVIPLYRTSFAPSGPAD
ncbi:cytochrome C biogenesis protein [Flavonifractor sp. An135]|nr:cytochrome C biogenesis protein [Flavonifractor sp. An135]OUQ24306.1 cytochrome C biogenesis protein [Flavonifractor sp. An135]